MRRFRSKVEHEAIRNSLENDRKPPPYTANVTTAPTYNPSGRDFVKQPDKTESSLTDTLGVAETSEAASASPNFSKGTNSSFPSTPYL